jgi:hypothetical protein
MAGRVQLATRGTQDVFFTDNPEYTYFIKNFKKHTNFSMFTVDHDVQGDLEFGSTLRCTIPQNTGDLLKTLSFRVTLDTIAQPSPDVIGYTESIGHAMIEYVELYIGGTLIQRVPRDFFQIHSEQYVTQTKQMNLEKLVGKPSTELSGTRVYGGQLLPYLGGATAVRTCIVDVPFYFYNTPELAVPLCAIQEQECEVVIKLSPILECIVETNADKSTIYQTTYDTPGLIREFKVMTEMIALEEPERTKFQVSSTDYIISQIQTETVGIAEDQERVHHKMAFVNPVKELYFIIQRKDVTASPFDYDHLQQTLNGRYINHENLRYMELKLDDDVMLNPITGNMIHLRAVQSGIHHSRTQLFRRFYSYSFALEPERWYPTGQKNFSLVNEQLLDVYLNVPAPERELRVYALSHNILRIENGSARLLFQN